MVDPRVKGATGETKVRDTLRSATGLRWERVPGSGALDPKHGLKGDLYVPNANNIFCIEVKNYAEDHLTSKLLTSKSPMLLEWWQQTIREANQIGKKPLLIFKFDRSKLFVAYVEYPSSNVPYMFVNVFGHEIFVSTLEQWLALEKPKFVL